MIRLSVPGTLEYRDVAMRVVSAASKLVLPGRRGTKFDAQVVSAAGEAFNNIAIHGYGGDAARVGGEVELEIEIQGDVLLLRISDRGRSFDPLEVPDPELDDLPERGMGLFIIRNFVDHMVYTPGDPNVLELAKRCTAAGEDSAPPGPPSRPVRVSVSPAPLATPSGVKASKSGRAGSSRVRPVRRADSVPARARAGDSLRREQPAEPSLPLGSRRK